MNLTVISLREGLIKPDLRALYGALKPPLSCTTLIGLKASIRLLRSSLDPFILYYYVLNRLLTL